MCLSQVSAGLNIIEKINKFANFIRQRFRKKEVKNDPTYSYYYDNYEKYVKVYKNGNGIIINTATLVVTNSEKLDKIYRNINIEDGDINSSFPDLVKMMKAKVNERFDKYGFWYYSENDIINDVIEFYWSDMDLDKEDKKIKQNPKELRWIFKLNNSRIENGKRYKIIYIVSINGLYPVTAGILDKKKAYDYEFLEQNESTFNVRQKINKFRYIISFDGDIKLKQEPICKKCTEIMGFSNSPVAEIKDYNILYNKYIFEADNPIIGTIFKVSWKFKKGD